MPISIATSTLFLLPPSSLCSLRQFLRLGGVAMTGKNRIMIYGPKMTAPKSSNSRRRGRGAGDQRAGWRDPRAEILSGTNAYGCSSGHSVRNLWRAITSSIRLKLIGVTAFPRFLLKSLGTIDLRQEGDMARKSLGLSSEWFCDGGFARDHKWAASPSLRAIRLGQRPGTIYRPALWKVY